MTVCSEQARLTSLIRDGWVPPPDLEAFASGYVDVPGTPEEGGLGSHILLEEKAAEAAATSEACSAAKWSTVAGLDISFVKDSTDACACISILARKSLEPIAFVIKRATMDVPYIPGYLAFREAPLLLELVSMWSKLVEEGLPASVCSELAARKPSRRNVVADKTVFVTEEGLEVHLQEGWRRRVSELESCAASCCSSEIPSLPRLDMLMVDGNGYHHPRRCGAAVAVGVESGLPTVGVGKALHAFGRLSRDAVEARAARGLEQRGQWMLIHCPLAEAGADSAVWEATGAAMLTGKSAKNPIFVSVGQGVSLRNACAVAASVARHRVPEPVRQADLFSRRWLRQQEAAAAGKRVRGLQQQAKAASSV